MIVAGIDPGKEGGIVIINDGLKDEPIVQCKFKIPKVGKEIDLKGLCKVISNLKDVDMIIIEEPHSIYGTSKGSMFTMGRIIGNIEAAIVCNGLQSIKVKPKEWQKRVWKSLDVVKKENGKTNDTKATSLNACMRLFPNEDFTRDSNEVVKRERTKQHDGLVDAALIAYYGCDIFSF